MTNHLLDKFKHSSHQIRLLEQEIAALETALQQTEHALNIFERQISVQLSSQIDRIRELTALYKKQQDNKKAWRLQQKKKGKNYREPVGLVKLKRKITGDDPLDPEDRQELRRLYKEAIMQVHPDKFSRESDLLSEKATALTVQLIDIYKGGNLDDLKDFHEHIISGNALSHVPFAPETVADPAALLVYLLKKRDEMIQMLEELKASAFHRVLTTYVDPFTFIDELRLLFEQRIVQLEKRMKSKWQ